MSDAGASSARESRIARSAARTLWIGAISLIVFSAAALAYTNYTWTSTGNFPPTDPIPTVIASVLSSFSQSTLTGGILCGGLALAVTALSAEWRSLAAVDERAPTVGDGEHGPIAEAAASDVPSRLGRPEPAMPAQARPIDPEAFKRPRADSHPAS